MKILPVKLLYPGLLAAALLSAGAGLAYGAYANYNACRCAQPSPGVDIPSVCCLSEYAKNDGTIWGGTDGDPNCGCVYPKSWVAAQHQCRTPCANVTCGGSTPYKNTAFTYDEVGPNTSNNCCTATPPVVTTYHWHKTLGATSTVLSNTGQTYVPTAGGDVANNPMAGCAGQPTTDCGTAWNNWKQGRVCTEGATCSTQGSTCQNASSSPTYSIGIFLTSSTLCPDKAGNCSSCSPYYGSTGNVEAYDCYGSGGYVGRFSNGTIWSLYQCICYVYYETFTCQ